MTKKYVATAAMEIRGRLTTEEHRALQALAERNVRPMSAEIRYAIVEHLKREGVYPGGE